MWIMDANIVGIIIAIVATGATLVGTVISMMFWIRQETNMLRAEAKEDRKDFIQISRNIEFEMRDFHNKLIEIERERLAR